jgi:hypothetical protein
MNRHCLDPRVLGPIAVATAVFLWRPLPAPAPAPVPARAVELPPLHGQVAPRDDADYVLDGDRSTVRFLVGDRGRDHLAVCRRANGRLRLPASGAPAEFELELDLGSLQPVAAEAAGLDLWELLGVHRGSQLVYRASARRHTTSELPGLTQVLWLGTLRLDDRIVQQPMELWQVRLPGQPLRLQGHGSVAGDTYGLPARSWYGLPTHSHVVTLGLDLVWRRRRDR